MQRQGSVRLGEAQAESPAGPTGGGEGQAGRIPERLRLFPTSPEPSLPWPLLRPAKRNLKSFIVALVLGVALAARVGSEARAETAHEPVVVELFTAQGCSACPPAEAMLAELARRPEVIALALHVDYWDYLGWPDPFAEPEHGERQKQYARANGLQTIFTPQIVVMGEDIFEGFRAEAVEDAIAFHLNRPRRAHLVLERRAGGALRIRAFTVSEPSSVSPPLVATEAHTAEIVARQAPGLPLSGLTSDFQTFDVQLVRYLPRVTAEILAGENAGLSLDHVNVVRGWQIVGQWALDEPLDLTVPLEGNLPAAVLVQEEGGGRIVAAAKLE